VITLPAWVPYALIPILALALRTGFRWLFSLDEDLTGKAGVITIPLRPVARISEWLLMGVASLIIVSSVESFNNPSRSDWPGLLLFGVGFALLTGFIANTHLWLDDEGMHYRIGVGRIKFISFGHLDHFEIKKDTGYQSGTTFYYLFRSNDGETISISRSSYDVNQLLLKIREHKSVAEKPYDPSRY
jgi:hypothetical protein